jgi:hypothetical protein
MREGVHTVVETPAYLADARAAGLTEAEREAIVEMVAKNPEAGDEIAGSGGARKVRVAGRGKGKSGGYRAISFYSGKDIPVFLLTIYIEGRESEPEQSGAQRVEGHFG